HHSRLVRELLRESVNDCQQCVDPPFPENGDPTQLTHSLRLRQVARRNKGERVLTQISQIESPGQSLLATTQYSSRRSARPLDTTCRISFRNDRVVGSHPTSFFRCLPARTR